VHYLFVIVFVYDRLLIQMWFIDKTAKGQKHAFKNVIFY